MKILWSLNGFKMITEPFTGVVIPNHQHEPENVKIKWWTVSTATKVANTDQNLSRSLWISIIQQHLKLIFSLINPKSQMEKLKSQMKKPGDEPEMSNQIQNQVINNLHSHKSFKCRPKSQKITLNLNHTAAYEIDFSTD